MTFFNVRTSRLWDLGTIHGFFCPPQFARPEDASRGFRLPLHNLIVITEKKSVVDAKAVAQARLQAVEETAAAMLAT